MFLTWGGGGLRQILIHSLLTLIYLICFTFWCLAVEAGRLMGMLLVPLYRHRAKVKTFLSVVYCCVSVLLQCVLHLFALSWHLNSAVRGQVWADRSWAADVWTLACAASIHCYNLVSVINRYRLLWAHTKSVDMSPPLLVHVRDSCFQLALGSKLVVQCDITPNIWFTGEELINVDSSEVSGE